MPATEKLEVHAGHSSEKADISEFEPRVSDEAGRGMDYSWIEDVERLDQLIGCYFPIAQTAEQDFDRALRASYIVIELIETQITLLESLF